MLVHRQILTLLCTSTLVVFSQSCRQQTESSRISGAPPIQGELPVEIPVELPVEETTPVEAPVRAPQIARFEAWLDVIERDLYGPELEVVDRLVANKARAAVFNIQGLGRLYEDQAPLFKTLHKNFKKFEDAIGDYQKWNDYYNEGVKVGSNETVMAKLIAKRDKARVGLQETLLKLRFLPNDGGPSYIQQLRQDLALYPWKKPMVDKLEMRLKLIAELETIKSTVYDFTHLEEGDGVHEFRRKMRWFSMETRALNGLVTLKDRSDCPVPSYASIVYAGIATTKYAVLPPSPTETSPVQISACLYVKVADLVERVNWIKARVEAEETLGEGQGTDLVSEADQLTLNLMWNDAVSNDLFGRLQDELSMN